jgi:putative DNA primase/helicase
MFGSDTYLLAQIANGEPDGSTDEYDMTWISPALRPLVERLLAAGSNERRAIWDEFLARGFERAPTLQTAPEPGPPSGAVVAPMEPPSPPNPPEPTPVTPYPGRAGSERGVRMTRALDVEPREIEWLWAGRVPLGMMTMFAGDPKLGKSFVTLAMAAALSRGLPLPLSDRPDRPGSTILMSAEDDPARTIVPRLTAAGADLAKVHILESVVRANGDEAIPTLRADIAAIMTAATSLGDCRLIVIDPVSAYLSGIDDNRNAVLRGVLTPLKSLAERLGAAIVLVSHLTKDGSANGKRRVLGSIGYVGACRANYLFATDPEDLTGRCVLMLDNGGNVAPPAPTLAYMIEDRDNGPQVTWHDEPVPLTVEQALRPNLSIPDEQEQAFVGRECDQWLREMLTAGPVLHARLMSVGREAGFTVDGLRRAKERIGVMAYRDGFGPGSRFYWKLKSASISEA